MTNIELLKLLKEKKVADAFQYYEACSYKLYLAQVSCEALDKVINDFEANGANAVKQVFQDALRTGTGSYKFKLIRGESIANRKSVINTSDSRIRQLPRICWSIYCGLERCP